MNLLGPFYFNALTHPWALTLIGAVILLFAAEVLARPSGALTVSTGETLHRIRGHGRLMVRHLPAVLRALGLTLLIVALARPLHGYEIRKDRANVIDIMMAVDVSGSMKAADFIVPGRNQRLDRITVTKEAVRHFINSRKERQGDRYGMDRVGLVLYGAYAWTQCPLTLDYGILERELEMAVVDERDPRSQKTAIGSAIGLAVSRLRKSEAKTKIIILLTDGINNSGELDPLTAAELARDYGIRIYTIGAGSPEGGLTAQRSLLGLLARRSSEPIDEESLKTIAEKTGGKYYRATDIDSLLGAYEEISQLETTEIEVGDFYQYEEGFMPYALLGSLALLASIISRRTWFEAIP